MKGARLAEVRPAEAGRSSAFRSRPYGPSGAIFQRWFVAAQHGLDEVTKAKFRTPRLCLGLELADHDDCAGRDQRMDASRLGVLDQRAVPVRVDPAAGPQRRHSTRRNMAVYRRGLPVQRRRLRAVQLVCVAHGHYLARRDRQLLHADLGEPDGLADSRRASEHQGGDRFGVVRQRTDRARLSGGDGAVGGRAAACALLRPQLGRRHGLHEMGAHVGGLARDHGVADRARRGRLRGGGYCCSTECRRRRRCRSKPFWR